MYKKNTPCHHCHHRLGNTINMHKNTPCHHCHHRLGDNLCTYGQHKALPYMVYIYIHQVDYYDSGDCHH